MLRCLDCSETYQDVFRLRCRCGGILKLEKSYKKSFDELLSREMIDNTRYMNFTPVEKDFVPDLTLPITPVVEKAMDSVQAIFKADYRMPSLSFKDRGTYVTIAKLKEAGIEEVSLDSSGNAVISLALYGRAEDIKVHAFIPESIDEKKKEILKLLGAEIHEISEDRIRVHDKAKSFDGAEYVSHWFNPYFLEGTKIAAYEAVEQVDPNSVIVPTGSGTLFLGMYNGFEELKDFGIIEEIPRMIAVEARGFESLTEKSEDISKLAEGIKITDPPRKNQMLNALEKTDGFSISVGDGQIGKAMGELLSFGFVVEPTSATAFAAFRDLLREGKFEENEKVLIPLTGSGFKFLFEGFSGVK
ncbi:threonine synthase [candidate division MSBL1 archaeon SCGC-AAA382A20]|uniref:Threonine synthase n=1 Tax=candidate division MSBL1 archaeon SCGC-AAA382A20 TaxID=1698280 RepID=A0A133VL47_9EURY|nr:threonine synthase [candidate division MSBL1 archaeon SCGC-AAA382A20]